MGWFGMRTTRASETARVIEKAARETHEVYGPPGDLVTAIVVAAEAVRQDLAPVFGYNAATPSEPEILLLFESLYFFSHLALRFAVRDQLTDEQIGRLQALMGPMLAETAVDSFFAHWPEDRKKRIRSDFFAKLNDAEQEYAACRTLVSQEDPLGADSLFGLVSRNACALNERSDDVAALTTALRSFTSAFSGMDLAARIPKVKAVIDRVDPNELASFWARGA